MRNFVFSDWSKNCQHLLFRGIVGIHHSGKNGFDGVRFDAVYEMTTENLPLIDYEDFKWILIDDENDRMVEFINNGSVYYAPLLKKRARKTSHMCHGQFGSVPLFRKNNSSKNEIIKNQEKTIQELKEQVTRLEIENKNLRIQIDNFEINK